MWELAVPLAVNAYKTFYGNRQQQQAQKALEQLERTPRPAYQTGEQLYDRADAKATGFTPEERARANQGFSQLNNTRFNLATQRNPTLTGAVQAGINYGATGQQLGLAAQDAQLRRQNLSQLMSVIGRQSNMQTQADLRNREQMEQAYGMANQAGVKNEFSGLEGAASMLYNNYTNNQYLKAMGGGGAGSPMARPIIPTMPKIPMAQSGGMGLRTQMSTPYPTYPYVPPAPPPTDWNNPYGANRDMGEYTMTPNSGVPYNPYQFGIPSVYAR